MSAQLSLVLSNGTLIEYKKGEYVSHSVTDGGVLTIETNARAELGTKVRTTKYSPAAWHSIASDAQVPAINFQGPEGLLGAPTRPV